MCTSDDTPSLLTDICGALITQKSQDEFQAPPSPDPLEGWCVHFSKHGHLRPQVTESSGPAASESKSSSGSESAGIQAHGVGAQPWAQQLVMRPTGAETDRPVQPQTGGRRRGAEARRSTGDKRPGVGRTRRGPPLPLAYARGAEHSPLCAVGTGLRAGSARKTRCQPNVGLPQAWSKQEL